MDRRMMMQSAAGKSDMHGWSNGIAYTDIVVVKNQYVGTNGAFTQYTGWDRTGYVPCNGAATLEVPKLSGSGGDTQYCAFYTEDHTYIRKFNVAHGTGYTVVSVPANAYYFVLSETAASLAYWLETGVIPRA